VAKPESVDRVYLDASCLLGTIMGDAAVRPLTTVLDRLDAGRLTLVASTALLIEVRPAHPRGDDAARTKLRRLLEAPATELIDVDVTVAHRAAAYAGEYTMKTWDAVHLATAVAGRCDVLFALDGRFPLDVVVDGTLVSRPYDLDGPHLFNVDDEESTGSS
jgi:predicted nucleic acid-binding protein